MKPTLTRHIKDTTLKLLQIPSTIVAKLAMEHPSISAKHIPLRPGSLVNVLDKNESPYPQLIPPVHLREGYGPTDQDYLNSGSIHVSNMWVTIRDAVGPLNHNRILDFGCAAGRMTRYVPDRFVACNKLYGCDINAESILWCQQNLQGRFFTNTTAPHLPFRECYFDLIYAGSVFSHISELTDMWLMELRRCLTFDGLLYVTICDEGTMAALENDNSKWADIMRPHQHLRGKFDMLSVRRSPKGAQVFYSLVYFKAMLERCGFEVLATKPNAYGIQTAILARAV